MSMYYRNMVHLKNELNMVEQELKILDQKYRNEEMYRDGRERKPQRDLKKKIDMFQKDKARLLYHINELENIKFVMTTPEAQIKETKSYIENMEEKYRIYYEQWEQNYMEWHKRQTKLEEIDIKLGLCMEKNDEYTSYYAEYQKYAQERNMHNNRCIDSRMKIRVSQDIRRAMYSRLKQLESST
jgi:hypothetical protein